MASSGCDETEQTETTVPVVRIVKDGPVGRIILNRANVYNAFDEYMIRSITAAAEVLDGDADIRAIVLSGNGRCFCAGADIDYMRRTGDFDWESNLEDARRLAAMYRALDGLSKPLLARVHGPTFGGGVGLVATADFVFAGPRATFSLSEVKLGLVPAVIGPYVQRRVGVARARGLFATGARIRGFDAVHLGLVDILCESDEEMDARIHEVLETTVACGPRAVARSRALASEIAGKHPAELVEAMAELSARTRATAEAQDGLSAFLEKRRPRFARSLASGEVPREARNLAGGEVPREAGNLAGGAEEGGDAG